MSIARREPKWRRRSLSWAGQPEFMQRQYASPSARRATPPQAGQRSGKRNGAAPGGRLAAMTWTT